MKNATNTSCSFAVGAFIAFVALLMFLFAWSTLAPGFNQNALLAYIQGNGTIYPTFSFKYALGGMFAAQLLIFGATIALLKSHSRFKVVLVFSIISLVICFASTLPMPLFKTYIRPVGYVLLFWLIAFTFSFALKGLVGILENNKKIKDACRIYLFQKLVLMFSIVTFVLGVFFCFGLVSALPFFVIAGNLSFIVCAFTFLLACGSFIVAQKALRFIK